MKTSALHLNGDQVSTTADIQTSVHTCTDEKYVCKSKTAAICTIRRERGGKDTVRGDLCLALCKTKNPPQGRKYLHELFSAKIVKQRSKCRRLEITPNKM